MKRSSLIFYCPTAKTIIRHKQLGFVQTFAQASNSVILSTALFLVWKFPTLPTPDRRHENVTFRFSPKHFPNLHGGIHPMYGSWLQTLCKQVDADDAVRDNEDLYLRIRVDQEYAKILETHGFESTKYEGDISWDIIKPGLEQKLKKQRQHVLFVSCSPLKAARPKVPLIALYYGIYFDNQRWTSFNIFQTKPTRELLKKADLIIVPGSSHSVNQGLPQIQFLIGQLAAAYKECPQMKILGVCFGCQLIAPVFGGKVGKAQQGTFGQNQIDIHLQVVKKLNFSYLTPLLAHQKMKVSQFHGDEVSQLPQIFQIISSSDTCKCEVIVSKNARVLGIQCHPEYAAGFIKMFEIAMKNYVKEVDEEYIESVEKAPVKSEDNGGTVLREVIKQFIKYTPAHLPQPKY